MKMKVRTQPDWHPQQYHCTFSAPRSGAPAAADNAAADAIASARPRVRVRPHPVAPRMRARQCGDVGDECGGTNLQLVWTDMTPRTTTMKTAMVTSSRQHMYLGLNPWNIRNKPKSRVPALRKISVSPLPKTKVDMKTTLHNPNPNPNPQPVWSDPQALVASGSFFFLVFVLLGSSWPSGTSVSPFRGCRGPSLDCACLWRRCCLRARSWNWPGGHFTVFRIASTLRYL